MMKVKETAVAQITSEPKTNASRDNLYLNTKQDKNKIRNNCKEIMKQIQK